MSETQSGRRRIKLHKSHSFPKNTSASNEYKQHSKHELETQSFEITQIMECEEKYDEHLFKLFCEMKMPSLYIFYTILGNE